MRRWIYKTDEAGKPRRFLNHREAVLWALTTVGKVSGVVALYLLVGSIFGPLGGGEVGRSVLTLVPLAIMLTIGLLIAFAMYLYVALSGGVMDDEARRRYRNNETLGSR